jgi:lipid A 3-O-deacylase
MAVKSSWVLLFSALFMLLSTSLALADDPSLIGLSVGRYDQDWVEPHFLFLNAGHGGNDKATDFRLEYRFGTSLVSWTDPYVKIKPFMGLQATSDLAIYGLGGILFDIALGPVMITPSFGVGLYGRGEGRDLGFPVEFRSQLELGYRFENQMRVSVAYSHISNANLSETNPGVDIISAYLHFPVDMIIGN